ncbi:CDP-diacylglycerol--glycerol-3-phosphate 3-phosphatidyltransferase [Lentisphaera profundi]|uniref:CDP-diacylglycerol--glycerol-3-phosphate 3-phosphatidyltransferase n=1 Tax=Lentisphaera profundi TaxID=1658616 RepID=A0ABY7VR88_9BACT|nr:CDP-diacylglycerol--glycerol-3-phosphate 3-phosphatidyltransferase [Lentisphaera profundi]WDE96720.1 CDP-diacylglycerol--glycerol-3-phosphate 3-phosphatidyltransferase [Lentisphaera profundi]
MNIANKITVSRFGLTLVFVLLAQFDQHVFFRWLALIVAVCAALSDFLDGYLARKYKLVTDFGKLMDPLADKILVAAAFFILCKKSITPDWFAIIIVTREFAVTGLRQIAASKGIIIQADKSGKIKTAFQFTYLGIVALHWAINGNSIAISNNTLVFFLNAVMLITVYITLSSGYNYFINNKNLFNKNI